MINAYAIADLAILMGKACDTISTVATSVPMAEQNNNVDLVETYKGVLLNEAENLQHMVLTITGVIAEAVQEGDLRQDEAGSAFQEGELTDDLGDKTDTETGDVTVTEKEKEDE